MLVYLATNTVTGKRYVGITRHTVPRRWQQHVSTSKWAKTLLARAIAKHGAGAFVVETIGAADDWTSLCEAEKVAIEKYATLNPLGYNLTSGGVQGVRFDPDVHKRSAKSRTGRRASPEHRSAISAALKGKPKSKEHAAKMGARHRGKQISDAARLKTSQTLKGRPKSPEHRAKLAASLAKHNQSAEHRARISNLKKGKPLTPENRRAAAEAWRAWIAIPENRAVVSQRIADSNRRRRRSQPAQD